MNFGENLGNQMNNAQLVACIRSFRYKYNFDFVFGDRRLAVEMIAAALNNAGSAEPLKIAQAMEGMRWKYAIVREATMRADDHEILMPHYLGTFSTGTRYDSEKTGLGWRVGTTV